MPTVVEAAINRIADTEHENRHGHTDSGCDRPEQGDPAHLTVPGHSLTQSAPLHVDGSYELTTPASIAQSDSVIPGAAAGPIADKQ